MTDISVVSYALGSLAYLVLSALLLTGWRGRLQGGLLVTATLMTALWCAAEALWAGWGIPPAVVVQSAETLHFLAWCVFLAGMLGYKRHQVRFAKLLIYGISAVLLTGPLVFPLLAGGLLQETSVSRLFFLCYVLLTVGGLFLVENLYRNTRPEQRWGIKFLCLGAGALFAYNFFLYAEALLFDQVDMNLWHARGAVYMLGMPLIGVSVARNPEWSEGMFISRNLAFHTATLLAAGAYLIVMSVAGYYIRYFGGEWGTVLQIAFLFGAGLVLLILLFSGQLRARIRVALGKHFFRQHYDYREQWLNFTRALSLCKQEELSQECVVRAIANVVDSPGGLLWLRRKDGCLEQASHWGVSGGESEEIAADDSMLKYLVERNWVINLDEYRSDPELYMPLVLPEWVLGLPRAWLIVPLLDQDRLLGIVVIAQPRAKVPFNWELRDLLKTAATQAASHLAQLQAVEALAEARQFEGFHRLSAFVLHDIKNIIAQQSVLVGTAAQHKHKPEFVDDVVEIMEHSVTKMQRLMQLMRTGIADSKPASVNIVEVVIDALGNCAGGRPVPELTSVAANDLRVMMNRDRMTSVIENLVRNAQEATADDGRVSVKLTCDDHAVGILIEDTGSGMDAAFVRERLFRPFDTTKGDTGMGIGAYECREYIHNLGGNIQVESEPGEGTRVRVSLPLSSGQQTCDEAYTNMESAV